MVDVETREPTPEELAEAFWRLPSDEMALFLSHLGAQAPPAKWVMQLEFVTNDPGLTPAGRLLMEYMGEYARARKEGT